MTALEQTLNQINDVLSAFPIVMSGLIKTANKLAEADANKDQMLDKYQVADFLGVEVSTAKNLISQVNKLAQPKMVRNGKVLKSTLIKAHQGFYKDKLLEEIAEALKSKTESPQSIRLIFEQVNEHKGI